MWLDNVKANHFILSSVFLFISTNIYCTSLEPLPTNSEQSQFFRNLDTINDLICYYPSRTNPLIMGKVLQFSHATETQIIALVECPKIYTESAGRIQINCDLEIVKCFGCPPTATFSYAVYAYWWNDNEVKRTFVMPDYTGDKTYKWKCNATGSDGAPFHGTVALELANALDSTF